MACHSFSLGGPQKHLSERPHLEESQRKYTQAPDREVDTWPVGSREASDLEFRVGTSKGRADKKPCYPTSVSTPMGVCYTSDKKRCGYLVGKAEQLCRVKSNGIRIRRASG